MMPDDNLTQRLYDSGAEFNGEIIEQTDPWITILISWVLPIVIFIALGQYMSKKMMKNAGGPNSMMFGMGKSNAKVYVKSSEGIRFDDVAGEDEAKESLSRSSNISMIQASIRISELRCLKGYSLCWPSGNRKDNACQSGSRRIKCTFLFHVRFGIC